MIRRLIEEQEIRLPQKCLGQAYPCLLPAGKMRHAALEILIRKAQPERDAPDPALIIIALQMLKALYEPAVRRHRLLVRPVRDFLFHRPLALAEINDILESLAELIIQRAGSQLRLLLHIADRRRTVELHAAGIIFLLPQQTAHERRLARAIGADKAHPFPPGYGKLHIVEKLHDAKSLCESIHS